MKNKELIDLKNEYMETNTPKEIYGAIEMGMKRGRENMGKRKLNIIKLCASLILIFSMFTGALNLSSSFAETVSELPVIGNLVKVLVFVDGKSAGGEMTDGTDVEKVDVVEKVETDDIIISFLNDDNNTGLYKVKYENNPSTMTFDIGGARRFSASENFDEILASKHVKDIYTLMTLDDSLIRFVIEFNKPVIYEVKEVSNPARLVISVKEDVDFIYDNIYSIRTNSYHYGEQIGIVEENYMRTFNTRMLKDFEGMYFVELFSFDNKEDALVKLGELNDEKLLVEERFGNESPSNINAEFIDEKSESVNEQEAENASVKSIYQASISVDDNQFYGDIEITDAKINIYSESELKYSLGYDEVKLTKLKGEASFILRIEIEGDVILVSGLFSEFFDELSNHIE